ncbi:hypothetical protein DICSQDRAFT_57887 [Dichomitus squalens LYAD-421 SS1]|uniref:uncharacterized protein n=1 Tax=Dichomitus squalens (strain LYAD-421) TaxID=732165 RepID=UPI000441413C|nr:uncharacterized protein DICSQDRAFT_57887 [Dichomitus squalens LYAD-421 SS1]EJF62570.1 hypothetical protein DICSQDRAFT_57887 [Dichomitus squalens LYAD-421 SS1]
MNECDETRSALSPLTESEFDWDGIVPTSPANTKEAKRRKRQKKRQSTVAEQSQHRQEQVVARGLANVQANEQLEEQLLGAKVTQKHTCYRSVLAQIEAVDSTWGDFVEWVSDPMSGCKQVQYEGLFKNSVQVNRILDFWAQKNSRTGKRAMRVWAIDYTTHLVNREAESVTREGVLQSRQMPMTDSFILSFSLSEIHERIRMICPTTTVLLRAFSTTQRQRKKNEIPPSTEREHETRARRRAKNNTRSQNNSFVKHVMGVYLYATGAQRQNISVLSSMNICSTYPSIAGSAKATVHDPNCTPAPLSQSKTPIFFESLLARGAGLLRQLSHSCRLTTRYCAQTLPCGLVYDNINMMFKIAEQILGRKDSQENGTCATIFRLHQGARDEDMCTEDLLHSLDMAPPLTPDDILHTPEERGVFEASLEHTLLRVIVSGSDLFTRFTSKLHPCLPGTDDKIPLEQTEIHPLPAMNIDESSTAGNSEVVDAVFRELGYDIDKPVFYDTARLTFGDQLSISRLRSLFGIRTGHETIGRSYANIVSGPGFFHHQMALTHGIIETHWGDPSSGTRNPSCLSFFNTILDRKPIVLTSLPPYRVCRDLIFDTLTVSALHCLELVTGCESLEAYASTVSFDQLRSDVARIHKDFCSPARISDLRDARESELERREAVTQTESASPDDSLTPPPLTTGDMVFENACLFLRDALILREFTDAIKGGYSGRIIRVLKILALMYRGLGRTKYAHELLHLVHNLTHVWPKPLRNIMIKNWLVNPTEKPNAWVPVDLLQEHMNFWIKIIYKAQGSNTSWEWLQNISPCIALLRQLATQMHATFGARLGTKHHTPERDRDVMTLREAMQQHSVFQVQPGRILRGVNRGEVPNAVSAGLNLLNTPLQEYNHVFRQLQQRRRLEPLGPIPQDWPSTSPTPSVDSTPTATGSPMRQGPIAVALPEITVGRPTYMLWGRLKLQHHRMIPPVRADGMTTTNSIGRTSMTTTTRVWCSRRTMIPQ